MARNRWTLSYIVLVIEQFSAARPVPGNPDLCRQQFSVQWQYKPYGSTTPIRSQRHTALHNITHKPEWVRSNTEYHYPYSGGNQSWHNLAHANWAYTTGKRELYLANQSQCWPHRHTAMHIMVIPVLACRHYNTNCYR